MKRKHFISASALLPPLLLSCKDTMPQPRMPTIVKGKVIDENNMPVKNFGFSFGGYAGSLTNNTSTFRRISKQIKMECISFQLKFLQIRVTLNSLLLVLLKITEH